MTNICNGSKLVFRLFLNIIDANTIVRIITASLIYASPSFGIIAPAVLTTAGSRESSSTSPEQLARYIIPALDLKTNRSKIGNPRNKPKEAIKVIMLMLV